MAAGKQFSMEDMIGKEMMTMLNRMMNHGAVQKQKEPKTIFLNEKGTFGSDIFSQITIDVEEPKVNKGARMDNILGYFGAPCDDSDYIRFLASLKEVKYEGCDVLKDEDDKVLDNVKHIYTRISYPLAEPVFSHYVLKDGIEVKYSTILYANACAYKDIYMLEDEQCFEGNKAPLMGEKAAANAGVDAAGKREVFMMNRASSDGPFGIWGHVIGDLVYNGGSTVYVNEDTVFCEFYCDS